MASNSILAKMAVYISANTAEFNKSLKQSNQLLNNFASAVGVGLGSAAVFEGLKYGIGVISDFEKQMSEVQAITGTVGKEFDELSDAAKNLGTSTLYTAKQVGQLQVAYGRLGFNTDEILAATKATLDLATATGEDLAKSADVAGSTIRSFGLSANETQRVTDVMAASFNQTALGLDNFSEAMKYVAPIAAQANISLEQTTALLGVLADNGIRGSSAGTSLRKIISDLKGETGTFAEKLQKLAAKGISSADALDEVGRTAYASLLILTKNVPRINELTSSFENATGATSEMARVMSNNLAGDVTKLSTAFDGLLLKLSNVSGPLRSVTQELRFIIGALSGNTEIKLDKELDSLAESIKGVASEAKAQRSIEDFISTLEDLRRESGKPIDLGTVKSLTEKYKLTEDQSNKLYAAVVKVNKALSGDEIIVKNFDQYAKGYKDITTAAEAFKNEQYNSIFALQQQKAETERLFKVGEEVGDLEIKRLVTEISTRFKAIGVVNGYVKSLEKIIPVATKIDEVLNKADEARRKRGAQVLFKFSNTDLVKLIADQARAFQAAVKQHEEDFKLIIKVDDKQLTQLPDKITGIGTVLKNAVATATEGLKDVATQAKDQLVDISGLVANGITNLADALGTAIATGDFDNFGKAILRAVADFAQQFGALLIAQGVAIKAFEFGDAYTKIAAGIALVAAGAAIKGMIGKQKSVIPSGGGSGGGGGYRSSSNYGSSGAQDSKMQVEVVGVLRGQDIYLSGSNYEKANKFLKPNG